MNIQLTEKKEQIILSTLNLIHHYGFHGTPMSKIAKEANVAVGSIYHYFPSKEDLIIELYWYCKEKLNCDVFTGLTQEQSYEYRFKTIWKRWIGFYQQNIEIFGFLDQFYGSPFYEEVRNNVLGQKAERNKLIHFIDEGIREKHLKDLNVRLILSIYLGGAISLFRNCLVSKEDILEEEMNQLVEIIWNGVKI
ncbi:TetR/AcrR family transcriptional regulator [Sphingobacterium sp. BN32]|uniref:TetR/AcrR family transcriptional regulator n=1 Tax=Sphingobacterium sp. BN32 TaxID=3058432 RepID=UPI00265D0108|nr:TetR/AcrR family transcriptional regulator [Sphingobacterium sp. BN32]WKK57610.1 TetR/AcrR family transcriptional regulator [Sphingobacterium sp. BN32]